MKTQIPIHILLIFTVLVACIISCEKEESPKPSIPFVPLEGGTFIMGCTSEQYHCDKDELHVHQVTLDDFNISRYEITNSQYCNFLNDINIHSSGIYNNTLYIAVDSSYCQIDFIDEQWVSEKGREAYPVVGVTWMGAKAFCDWYGGRLPTEAEWEFAARGGTKSKEYVFSGSNEIGEVAWYKQNSNATGNSSFEKGKGTLPVGEKQPNELGLYDMSGNVWEWCSDWFHPSYYDVSPQNNPQGPETGKYRVLRGGGWDSQADFCRVSNRTYYPPDDCHFNIGFRICKDG